MPCDMRIKHCGICLNQVFTACTTVNCQIGDLVALQTVLLIKSCFSLYTVCVFVDLRECCGSLVCSSAVPVSAGSGVV